MSWWGLLEGLLCAVYKPQEATNCDAKLMFLDLLEGCGLSWSFIYASPKLWCIFYLEMEKAQFYSNLGERSELQVSSLCIRAY